MNDKSAIPDILPQVFQQAVEQADMAVSITDAKADILYVNPAFCRVTGYEAAEVLGRNQSILSNKTTPPAIYQALWEKISRGEAWSGRLVNRRRDGGKYLAELLITPVIDGAGAISHYLGLHRDITELYALECQVRNDKALIESAVEAAPLVMALLDGEERVVLDNREYKRLLAELGSEPAKLILEAVKNGEGRGCAPPQEGGQAFTDREVRIDRAGGPAPRWFSCSGTWVRRDKGGADAFFDRESHVYLLLVAKETTRQRAEQEKTRMAALQAVLAEENRVDGLRETLSAAVFQMEGPINVMSSVLAMMGRRGAHDPVSAALNEALGAARQALGTLRGAIPERPAETPTAVNLNEVLQDVIELATRRLLGAGIGVAWKPQAVLPNIHGCPNRLRAMLKALVDNAIDAMNVRGWRERELRVATRALADAVELTIEDTGPGVPAELRLKVFEPFFSTHRPSGHHLGTGLTAAQQVALDHGGGIELDPAEGGGCRVTVVLPLRNTVGEPT
ncbi:MAG TPA: nitrogen fixation negative regulator NifL [Rhodocyclaceae bacterium]|nr:nitrogen fixation negative regulator NifL [Rhodocyclaceae bacterium]